MIQTRGALVRALLLALAIAAGTNGCGSGAGTGTGRAAPHFEPGFNLFSPEQDVQLGRQSAAQVVEQMPLLRDSEIQNYVGELGKRLAVHAPGEKYPYEFRVLDVKDVNAFALPGGFIFVNRGTLEAARDEGELAGVIAHEITHVALRHGTNQVSKAYVAQAGLGILTQILRGRDGEGAVGDIMAAVGGLGLNAAFLKMGRTAETQADLAGAGIMAAAGYDPIDMADFFRTLEQQRGGQGVPEFLSDHPDPGNRVRSIEQVKPSLKVSPKPIGETPAFRAVKARLKALPSATGRQAQKIASGPGDGAGAARPPRPSASMSTYESPTGAYQIAYPDNWDALSDKGDGAAFAPRGGYGKLGENVVFTHGTLVGVIDAGTSDLEGATQAFVRAQLRSNPEFEVAQPPQRVTVGGKPGLGTVIAGQSPVTGELEVDVVYTTVMANGQLFYVITAAPKNEYDAYTPAFEEMMASVRLSE
jgi:hypothetical protein